MHTITRAKYHLDAKKKADFFEEERALHGGRFRGGLVLKAHGLCVSLNCRLESNKEEEEKEPWNVLSAVERMWHTYTVKARFWP